jgi:RNA-directed DNA polymerase
VANRRALWEEAWRWLTRQRRHAPANSGVWHLMFWRHRDDEALYQRVLRGAYRLSPLRIKGRRHDEKVAVWSACDALVLKWLALQIAGRFPQYPNCHSVKGAGIRHSLRTVAEAYYSGRYAFVYRTDIKGYYQHIRKTDVLELISHYVPEPELRQIIEQYLYYSVEQGGEFRTPASGISRGCPLSPLIGVALLSHVEAAFSEHKEVFYVRYMDDFLLMAPRRWPLRRAIKQLNGFLSARGFTIHPDKTQIGKAAQGFDWLGVQFTAGGMYPSQRAMNKHREHCLRLYEQARRMGMTESQARERVQKYVARWQQLFGESCKL